MAISKSAEVNNDLFSAEVIDQIAVMTFKKDLLLYVSDLNLKELLFDYLDGLSKNKHVRLLLIIGSPEKKGGEEYLKFYSDVFGSGRDLNELERLYNAVNQFILNIVRLDKTVIHADSGKIISIFMNIAFACDYRIIGDNAQFENPYLNLGLVPKGGGAFFLSKMVGRGKTFEILTSDHTINAKEALKLGLVDKVCPEEKLYDEALNMANHFIKQPKGTLWGIKRLLNYDLKDLEKYLEYENETLRLIIKSSDFLLSKNKII
jgi:2-(1,2-epoxy-1,2-dihydrophenyl)acetyl-CoA isomerase